MTIYDKFFQNVQIPALTPVTFDLPHGTITKKDIPDIVNREIDRMNIGDRFKGASIAVTGGSREVNLIADILHCVVAKLKALGADPFVIPAMGSHGGATAEGQIEVLAHYGVTEESLGCPIRSSMETVILDTSDYGLNVHLDKFAYNADFIIPVGRVKAHTDFHGNVESGLLKMLAIGCGKQAGAYANHTFGMDQMPKNVFFCATTIMKHKVIPFGLAIIEDAFHGTYKLRAIKGENIVEEEPALLKEAKSLLPCIPFQKADVLVLEEVGKDVSGPGMDPNVTGRSASLGISQPYFSRVAVLGLTEKTDHNAAGIGMTDVITRHVFENIDLDKTYPNCITSHDMQGLKIPAVMPNDLNALRLAIDSCPADCIKNCRMVWMRNTLHLDTFLVSASLLPEVEKDPRLHVAGPEMVLEFGEDGYLKRRPTEFFGI